MLATSDRTGRAEGEEEEEKAKQEEEEEEEKERESWCRLIERIVYLVACILAVSKETCSVP